MRALRKIVVGIVLIINFNSPVAASWLSDVTGVDINVPNGTITVGTPNPAAIVPMIQNAPRDIATFFLNPAGPAVALLIRQAKAQYAQISRPIPENIVKRLAPFFPPEILQARWAPYDPGRATIGNLINWLQNEGAVVFDDVVVFLNPNDPENGITNAVLWAHELTHVMQYRNMGVEGFAAVYSSAWWEIEQQAKDWAAQVKGKLGREPLPSTSNYYALSAQAFRQPLDTAAIVNVARLIIPPEHCINITGNRMHNICPAPLHVAHVARRRNFQGELIWESCLDIPNASCSIPANYNGPLIAPPPMISVRYGHGVGVQDQVRYYCQITGRDEYCRADATGESQRCVCQRARPPGPPGTPGATRLGGQTTRSPLGTAWD